MFNKLSQAIEYYQEYHLTKHKYHYRAHNLRFFDAYDLRDIKKRQVKEYARYRRVTVSNATINREIAFARAAINRVNDDHDITINNPFERVKFQESDYIAKISKPPRSISVYCHQLCRPIIMIYMILLFF